MGVIRSDLLSSVVKGFNGGDGDINISIHLNDASHALAAVGAVARCFPVYNRKKDVKVKKVNTDFVVKTGTVDYERVTRIAEGVRLAAELVDMPALELNSSMSLPISISCILAFIIVSVL